MVGMVEPWTCGVEVEPVGLGFPPVQEAVSVAESWMVPPMLGLISTNGVGGGMNLVAGSCTQTAGQCWHHWKSRRLQIPLCSGFQCQWLLDKRIQTLGYLSPKTTLHWRLSVTGLAHLHWSMKVGQQGVLARMAKEASLLSVVLELITSQSVV